LKTDRYRTAIINFKNLTRYCGDAIKNSYIATAPLWFIKYCYELDGAWLFTISNILAIDKIFKIRSFYIAGHSISVQVHAFLIVFQKGSTASAPLHHDAGNAVVLISAVALPWTSPR